MEKINSVYVVENKIGGGMKNIEKSKKEVNTLHGEVSVYELNKPQSYEVFSSWPEDIQKEYLKKLYWTHGGTLKKIGGLFGFSHMWTKDKFDSLGIPTMSHAEANRAVLDRVKKWDAFLRGGTCIKDMIPEETKQQLEKMASGICGEDSHAEEKQVSPVSTTTTMPSPHIVEIRKKMMALLEKMPNEDFAELAYGIQSHDLGRLFDGILNVENTICKTCHRLFGEGRCDTNLDCPISFGKWLEVADTDAGDFELLKWWAKEDTRLHMAKNSEG